MEFKMKENGFVTQAEYGELHISGNEEYGFRPYQLLVSSIAVCSGGVLRKILEKQRLVIDDLSITTDVTRNEEIPQEIQRIHLHFVIKGQKLVEEKIEKALILTRKHCSMVQSVKDSIDVTESFDIIS
jgi:putative redox protein